MKIRTVRNVAIRFGTLIASSLVPIMSIAKASSQVLPCGWSRYRVGFCSGGFPTAKVSKPLVYPRP